MELTPSVILAALLGLVLAACSPPPLPPDVAPPAPRAERAPYRKGVPAPDVQPEPANPFVRDARAESILAHIGSIEGHLARADDESRAASNGRADGCLSRVRVQLASIERQARARRSDLRDAAFDDPAAEDRIFSELSGFAARAHQVAGECPKLAAYREGDEYKLRTRELEGRVSGLERQIRESPARGAVTVDMGGEIMLTGPLAGAPAVRRLSSARTVAQSLSRAVSGIFASPQMRAPAATPPAPPPPATPSPAGPPIAAPAVSPFARGAHDPSMLLRSAQITLAVFEVDKKMAAVQALATDLGGYLALRGDRELTVRVPRERFDEALRRVEAIGDVLHRSVAAEDVTDQFVDLELRLKNAQAVRARLEKLLETASVKDAVEIHKELAKITEEIERLEGKLKLLRDRIAFSTITVTFERVEPQKIRSQALLPFSWMRTMGLQPLLQVSR